MIIIKCIINNNNNNNEEMTNNFTTYLNIRNNTKGL